MTDLDLSNIVARLEKLNRALDGATDARVIAGLTYQRTMLVARLPRNITAPVTTLRVNLLEVARCR